MSTYKELLFDRSFVNGEWASQGTEKFDVKNPFDLSVIGQVHDEDRTFVAKAIDVAHATFGSWKSKSAKERSAILLKWFDLIHQHKDELAQVMSLESGKPLAESKGEIDYGAAYIQWFAE
ncbi:MAG: aldehyde dehydrogenase family protein, partial [Sphingobacterium sp.]|nr:aldehyde dehydrogenase family protein [Sphingobacterium sp.]